MIWTIKVLISNSLNLFKLLTSFKTFEGIMYKRFHNNVLENNVLFENQFGLQFSHSTKYMFIHLMNCLWLGFDWKWYDLGIFLDLSKKFDTVNHTTDKIC